MPTSPLTGEALGGAGESLLPTLGFLAAQAAAVGVGAPLIEGDDLHAGRDVSIGDALSAVGHGITQGVQGERGVLWNLHRSLCRLGGRRRLVLDHHRGGDRIAIAVVLVDDDGLQGEGDALAFLMVARLFTTSASRAPSLLTTWMVVSTAPSSAPWPRMRSLPSTG